MTQRKLQGRVAIVTGAGRGIGREAARTLATAGAAVVAMARSEDEVIPVVTGIRKAGGRAIATIGDVSDLVQVEEAVGAALTEFGRVDILVNNAGQVWPVEAIVDVDPEEWAYTVHVNLIGPFYMVRNVLPVMLEQEYGRIVTVGVDPEQPRLPGGSAYHCAKSGLDTLCTYLARELDGSGILANLLYPAWTDTELQADIRALDTDETDLALEPWLAAHESGGLSPVADVGKFLLWLSGPWVTSNGAVYRAWDEKWRAQVQTALHLP